MMLDKAVQGSGKELQAPSSASFDFPRHGEREYLWAIDITAIIIIDHGDRLEVRATRDIERTVIALRSTSPRLRVISAWWVRNKKIANAVAGIANGEERAYLDAVISRESQQRGAIAVPHGIAMDRMRRAGGQIDQALRDANARGELAWLNRAYGVYRARRGSRAMGYPGIRARLRRAVVRRLVLTGSIEFGSDLLAEVFPGAVNTAA